MRSQEGGYIHLEQCLADLGEAWRILKALEEDAGASRFAFPAFKYAVIAYCRPFKVSRGAGGGKHTVGAEFLPPIHLALHTEAIELRDWILAHSDMDKAEAEIYVVATPEGKQVTHMRNAERGESLWAQRASFLALIEYALEVLTPRADAAKAELPATREFEY